MTTGEFLSSLIPWIFLAGAFVGSLFACKNWISRVLFTLVTPVVYGLVVFLCMMVFGCLAMLLPAGPASIFDELAIAMALCIAATLFCIQVAAMSKDGDTATYAYTLKLRGRKGDRVTAGEGLPHVVTQRRYERD